MLEKRLLGHVRRLRKTHVLAMVVNDQVHMVQFKKELDNQDENIASAFFECMDAHVRNHGEHT